MNTANASCWPPGYRAQQLAQLPDQQIDIVIVGGGINGAAILAEASHQGLTALLVEQRDFAAGASGNSSKMAHGGLRYLAAGQARLTISAVKERQRLLATMPGLVEPLPFLMGHYRQQFPPAALFNMVLAIYDAIAARCRTEAPVSVVAKKRLQHQQYPAADATFLVPGMRQQQLLALSRFTDGITDDARLVLRLIQQSCRLGGVALNYIAAQQLTRNQHGVITGISLSDKLTGKQFTVATKVVINATGAWADKFLGATAASAAVNSDAGGKTGRIAVKKIRPLRGSHLVLPYWRLPVACAVCFFHPTDRRPVYIYPWQGVTVVGTTDLDHQQDLDKPIVMSQLERDYLLTAANFIFPSAGLSVNDISASWSGVRPVLAQANASASATSREHQIWQQQGVFTVAGGKLTTFAPIARELMQQVTQYLTLGSVKPADKAAAVGPATQHVSNEKMRWAHIKTGGCNWQRRIYGRYGDAANAVIGYIQINNAKVMSSQVYWAEIDWILQHEQVITLQDLLLRRTPLAYYLAAELPELLVQLKSRCCRYLNWSDTQWHEQLSAFWQSWHQQQAALTNEQPARSKTADKAEQ